MNRSHILFALCTVLTLTLLGRPHGLSAHDNAIDTPDGLVAPPPPILPLPTDSQTLYHIDNTQSLARYSVQELYVGNIEGKRVVGETNVIAGDILIDWGTPTQSQLGMVTVNVEQLTSDSRQRDRQIRNGYLESSLYPEATYIPEEAQTFPDTIALGETVSFTLHGFLTVREVTVLSDWQVDLTLEAERLIGRATTDILMSDFGVGPINIVGLLSTEDAMQLTLDFVAVADGAAVPTVTPETADPVPVSVVGDVAFADIRPILETKCVGCHIAGEIGHSIYPMETVGDVTDYAADIGLVVETGFMPPWPPSEEAPQFLHDRSLTATEREQILAWVAAGAVTDLAADTPLNDTSPPSVQVREDVVLTMPAPYVPTGEQLDDYRCFLLDPQLADGGYVTASDILPDEGRVVHHAFIFQVSAEARAEAEQKSAEDDRTGWECYGDTGLSSTSPGAIADSLGAWVPGSQPLTVRDGTGLYVEPSNLFVLQIHYNYEAGYLPDQSRIVLQIEPPTADLAPVRGMGLTGPVEVPCPAGFDKPECDRDFVLNEAGIQFRVLADGILARCGQTVDDYAGNSADYAPSHCDSRVPFDGLLVQVDGHMHTYGTSLRVTLNPDSANPIIVQDIPIWDFNWQGSYQIADPIPVAKGDILQLTCVYANSQETDPDKVRRIIYGSGTNDEMCLAVVKVEPAAEYAALSTNEIMIESLTTVPEWLPTWGKSAWFIASFAPSLLPTGVYVTLLVVVGLIAYLIIRRRRRRVALG